MLSRSVLGFMREKVNERYQQIQDLTEYHAYVVGMLDMAECLMLSDELRKTIVTDDTIPQLETTKVR